MPRRRFSLCANAADERRQPAGGGPGIEPVFHQYVVRTPRREELREALRRHDILCGVLYPVPIHRQPAHAVPGCVLPETERACEEVLCLPCHPAMTLADAERVAGLIREFLAGSADRV